MNWFMNNLATIVIGAILLAAVVLAVRTLLKDREKGGCSCGCECGHAFEGEGSIKELNYRRCKCFHADRKSNEG